MRTTGLCSMTLTMIVGVALVAPLAARNGSPYRAALSAQGEAGKLKNPVAADATSIAAGKKAYEAHCTDCHGDAGKGDGPAAPYTDPKPPDLTDAEWKHGSTDGEIFTVIHDGVKGTDMKPFGTKLSEHEIWDVVNFLRSLGPTKPGT
jgi:mono/diheme cytochrome c family protein